MFCVKMKCIVFQEKQGQLVAMRDQIEVFKKKKHCYVTSAALSPSHRLYEPRGISTLGTIVGMSSTAGNAYTRAYCWGGRHCLFAHSQKTVDLFLTDWI